MIVIIELIEFYKVYDFVGITRIGGIATFLQSTRPSTIVCFLQTEKWTITLTVGKKTSMVLKAIIHRLVCPETLVPGIVVSILLASLPSVTLYTKVIIAILCQSTSPRSRLKHALG